MQIVPHTDLTHHRGDDNCCETMHCAFNGKMGITILMRKAHPYVEKFPTLKDAN